MRADVVNVWAVGPPINPQGEGSRTDAAQDRDEPGDEADPRPGQAHAVLAVLQVLLPGLLLSRLHV